MCLDDSCSKGDVKMELYQLQCFIEVAKYENMTTAAQKMYVSQSSLSKTIGRLEKSAGVQLFDRIGTTIKLNAYGRELLKSASQITEQIKHVEFLLEQMKSGDGGRINIGSTLLAYLDDLIDNFVVQNPNIAIKVVFGSADTLQRELINGSLDLIISTYPFGSSDFEEIDLFNEPMGVCMSRFHPLSNKKDLTLYDLRSEKFIVNNPSSDKSNQTIRACATAGFEPNVIFEGMLPRSCGTLVSMGRGVMVVCKSRFMYLQKKYENEYGTLIHKELADSSINRVTKITLVKNSNLPRSVETFIDYATKYGFDAFCGTMPRAYKLTESQL